MNILFLLLAIALFIALVLKNVPIVIATILRAGLPFHQGFLNYFDDAQNAFDDMQLPETGAEETEEEA